MTLRRPYVPGERVEHTQHILSGKIIFLTNPFLELPKKYMKVEGAPSRVKRIPPESPSLRSVYFPGGPRM
jgi:hypothetical protein